MSAPRATLVVVALVAAFGGVAWWLFSAEVPIHAPEFHATDGEADPARGDAGRRAASAAELEEGRTPIIGEAFADDEDERGEPREFETWPLEGVELEIVHESDGKPAVDAEVLWFEVGDVDADRWTRLDILRHDPEDTARRLARRFRTDDEGRCVVPHCKDYTLVMARDGGSFGGVRLTPSSIGPFKVELAPDEIVRIRARKPDGAPAAGVPIDVCYVSGPRVDVFLKYVADENGEAVCKNLGAFLEWSRRDPKAAARLGAPAAQRVEARFVPSPPPAEPVDLVVPALGETTAVLVDAKGERVRIDGYATLRAQFGGGPDGGTSAGEARARVVDGAARFPNVGLGLSLAVAFDLVDGSRAKGSAQGPSKEGEAVEITALRAASGPDLVGVAVDVEGARLFDRRLEARGFGSADRRAPLFRREIRTSRDGEFRLALFGAAPAQNRTGPLETIEFRLLENGANARTGLATLPQASFEGVESIPIGEVVFDDGPPLLTGVVVDEAGLPVRHARVETWRRATPEDAPKQGGKAPSRVREETLDVRADENGRFVVRGVRPPETYFFLRATRPGYAFEAQGEGPVGATDIRLVLARGGAVAARLLLDDDIPRDLLRGRIRVYAKDGKRDQKPLFSRETTPEPDGSLLFEGLPSGVAVAEVYAPSFSRAALDVVDGVEVRFEEGAAADPRLAAWDLRGRLRAVEIEAVDDSGRRLTDATYETIPRVGAPSKSDMNGGRAKIVGPAEPFDVQVTSPFKRACLLTSPSGFVQARLSEPHVVELVVGSNFPTLPEGHELVLKLQPWPKKGERKPDPAKEVYPLRREETLARPNDVVSYRVRAPGSYAAFWSVEVKRGSRVSSQGVGTGGSPPVAEVGPYDDVVRLATEAPTQAAVDRAIRRLK